MAPARPYWKGYLKLSLVSCPIALYTATLRRARIVPQINKKTGNRLRQQLVDEVTREPVEGEDKGRGYEYGKVFMSSSTMMNSMPSRSRVTIRSKSIRSFRANRLMSDIWRAPITSRRTNRSDRKPLRSFAKPCAARAWPPLAALFLQSASASSCSSRGTRG